MADGGEIAVHEAEVIDGKDVEAAAAAADPTVDDGTEVANTGVRAIIQAKEAGAIIGKRGGTIQFIRAQSQARINISDQGGSGGDTERVLTVTGNAEAIFRAFSFICEKLNELHAKEAAAAMPAGGAHAPRPVTLRLAIPNTQAGAVIGRQGTKVKEIREATGAQVQVEKDLLPHSTERPCIISGTPEAVAQSVFHIACIMIQVPAKGPTVHYQPGTVMPAMPFAHPYPPAPAGVPYQSGGHVSQQLQVPNHIIGSIIGRGGSKIKEIRTVSGANVKIADNEGNTDDRIITISGAPDACQLAAFLIQTRMNEAAMALSMGQQLN